MLTYEQWSLPDQCAVLPDLAKRCQSGKKVLPELAKSCQSGKKVGFYWTMNSAVDLTRQCYQIWPKAAKVEKSATRNGRTYHKLFEDKNRQKFCQKVPKMPKRAKNAFFLKVSTVRKLWIYVELWRLCWIFWAKKKEAHVHEKTVVPISVKSTWEQGRGIVAKRWMKIMTIIKLQTC